jgi:hypothetical protein
MTHGAAVIDAQRGHPSFVIAGECGTAGELIHDE